jgi:nucleoside-triphosphatase THEP1
MEIKKAIKSQQKLRLGISGASGSGKTYSALLLASSLGSKVCVIDTEQGSASLYADKFEFDVLELTAPYSSERYVEALKRVEMAGYDVIVIDSLSHNWNQSGGCLDKVNQIGGNSYAAWGKVTPQYDKLIHSILACKAHVVTTMRSKTAYGRK